MLEQPWFTLSILDLLPLNPRLEVTNCAVTEHFLIVMAQTMRRHSPNRDYLRSGEYNPRQDARACHGN
jgi:hypothetical protein